MTVWCVPRASCSERQPACFNWRGSQIHKYLDAEEELEILVERIGRAHEAVDAAEESVTGEKDAWDATADQANALQCTLDNPVTCASPNFLLFVGLDRVDIRDCRRMWPG
jgi:hypothetical protein